MASLSGTMATMRRRSRVILIVLLAVLTAAVAVGCRYRGYLAGLLPSTAAEAADLTVPPGFRIAVYADNVPNARQMALGPSGIVFVGSRAEGKVYAVVDRDGDHRADQVHVLASGLEHAERRRLPRRQPLRRRGQPHPALPRRRPRPRRKPPEPEVVSDAFPTDAHHGWKFIAFGPDGRLYVPVGAPCNICDAAGPAPRHDHAPRLDGGGGRRSSPAACATPSASTGSPGTGELWFTDNGRDWLGDDQPPDELNRADRRPGSTSAFPTATATASRDPEFGKPAAPATSSPRPRACSAPTSPPSACASTPARCSPRSTASGIFIAEHGSWNRSTPDRLPRELRAGRGRARATSYEPFARAGSRARAAGPPRRRARDARRLAARLRRQGRPDLPHLVRGGAMTP